MEVLEEVQFGDILLVVLVVLVVLEAGHLVMVHQMEPDLVQEQVNKDFLEETQVVAITQVVVEVLEEQELVALYYQMVVQV